MDGANAVRFPYAAADACSDARVTRDTSCQGGVAVAASNAEAEPRRGGQVVGDVDVAAQSARAIEPDRPEARWRRAKPFYCRHKPPPKRPRWVRPWPDPGWLIQAL